MKFYNREKELALLQKIEIRSRKNAQMTFMVGRRRIGKTSLLIKATENETFVYLFIAKKNEALLVSELAEEVHFKLGVELFGTFKTFKELFGYLMALSETKHFTLIIDEFQEFLYTNPSIYSDMQNSWDTKKGTSQLNLILCGSIYSLMKKIFENSKEPLFGRATQRIYLKSFNIKTLKEILADNSPNYTAEDLLAFYLITGGVAKYVELLIEAEAYTLEAMLDEIFSDNSNFLDEGKNILVDEFGKDYGNYFSILSLIASSKTSRVEMESMLEMQIGGFLDRLENDFGIIRKVRPLFSKPNSRSVKYKINDNFLSFWFRFIYKYRGAIETGNLEFVKNIVLRDYTTYSGAILEKYFMEKMIAEDNLSAIGSYWEKSNLNEIDIVAVNEYEKRLIVVEVKRQADKINRMDLEKKASSLVKKLDNYQVEYRGLSMVDM